MVIIMKGYTLDISLLLLTLCISCKYNSSIQNAVDDYRKGNITQDSLLTYVSDSIRVKDTFDWASRHQSKDDIASWFLGRYIFGLGVDSNPLKAKAYYISACKNGNIDAMSGLAQIYMTYPGHENLDSAFYWYNEAANHGDPDAYFYLGKVDINRNARTGLPIDTAKFIEYLQKGANLNSPIFCSLMATLYYYGECNTKTDKIKAFNLLKLVPNEKLDNNSNYLLGEMYELGEGVLIKVLILRYIIIKNQPSREIRMQCVNLVHFTNMVKV